MNDDDGEFKEDEERKQSYHPYNDDNNDDNGDGDDEKDNDDDDYDDNDDDNHFPPNVVLVSKLHPVQFLLVALSLLTLIHPDDNDCK